MKQYPVITREELSDLVAMLSKTVGREKFQVRYGDFLDYVQKYMTAQTIEERRTVAESFYHAFEGEPNLAKWLPLGANAFAEAYRFRNSPAPNRGGDPRAYLREELDE